MIVAEADVSRVAFKKENAKRLKEEWITLSKKNPALYSIVSHLAGYCGLTLCRNIMITQIYRADDEQKEIYGSNCKTKSPHQNWCAVDLRCFDYSLDERQHLERALRVYDHFNKFKHMPSASRTVWIHEVNGGGIHFHVQFWGANKQLPSCFQLKEPSPTFIA
jgi:hypothetical protein